MWFINSFLIILSYAFIASADNSDKDTVSQPCNIREEKYGLVCVCNSTYCDNQGKLPSNLTEGSVVYITSSKSGKRFAYDSGQMTKNTTTGGSLWSPLVPEFGFTKLTLNIDRNVTYQKILGFGGAFTDSAGINIMNVSEPVREFLLRSYFSEDGLNYNMGRVPIAGTDFSTHGYSYADVQSNGSSLENFSLTDEDFKYKIPLIKRAQNMSSEKLLLTSAVWSPPTWMKTINNYVGGFLKSEYYGAFAQYCHKFLEAYKNNGIDIWGISTGNEPLTGLTGPLSKLNSLAWTPSEQADWIYNYLGPKIRNSTQFNQTNILFLDDQRPTIDTWLPLMILAYPDIAEKYMDAIALHWYLDLEPTAFTLDELRKEYPDKWIINNEACIGSEPLQSKVEIGSWDRGEDYCKYMISDLNHQVQAWVDWNLALNPSGGPNWQGNNVDAPILVNAENDEFLKQPMFYTIGHLAKYVPRDSLRIGVKSPAVSHVPHTAFLRPNGHVVVIVLNNESTSKKLVINDADLSIQRNLEPHSITTMIYNPVV